MAIYGDYRVMALGDFRMGLNEVQVGLIPYGVIHGAFQRLVGGHAAQLLTRGALIDPATALRVGLVDELADVSQVPVRALEMAREICALPAEPMRRTREMVREDLVELFGDPAEAPRLEREFAALGAECWFAPATQERLRKMFTNGWCRVENLVIEKGSVSSRSHSIRDFLPGTTYRHRYSAGR